MVGSNPMTPTTTIRPLGVTLLLLFLTLSPGGVTPQNSPSSSKDKPIFTAVGPKLVRPNSIYYVTASVDTAPLNIQVAISSEYSNNTVEGVEVGPGAPKVIGVPVTNLTDYAYNLTVKGVGKDGASFVDQTSIFRDTKDTSILLQTDKPIYKPGETVHYRIVVLDRFLRPKPTQTVEIRISDPTGNVIQYVKDLTITNGLYTSQISLSSEPNLGDWRLQVTAQGQSTNTLETQSHSFSVDQYVLPKFKVDVILPPFATINNSKIIAEVKAAYTYGKPLVGDVEARLQEHYGYYYGQQLKIVSKKAPINGSAFVEFEIMKELVVENFYREKEFKIDATVKDVLTGREQNGTARIKVHLHPYKIDLIKRPVNYKPGFPIEFEFKVSSQDDTPIHDPRPDALKIAHGYTFKAEDGVFYKDIPSNGIVKVTLDTPTNELFGNPTIELTYKDLTQTFYPPSKLNSKTKTYTQLTLKTEKPTVGAPLDLHYKINKPFSSLNYVIYGRGLILTQGKINLPNPATEHKFQIPDTPASAAPEANIVVYSIVNDEVAVDSVKFTLDSVFENHLNLSLDKEKAEPGSNVSLSIGTNSGSVVALRGVDQSVLLLKEDKDIGIKSIEDEVKAYENQASNYRVWGGSSSFQVFEQAGLVVLTNGLLEKEQYHHYRPYQNVVALEFAAPQSTISSSGGAAGLAGAPGAPLRVGSVHKASTASGAPTRVRTHFPETWLWENLLVNSSSTSLVKQVPDTLTSWVITGYALNPQSGIGVSRTPKILETFRPFFITINAPYSIVKGEKVPLQVLVHNYMDATIKADVTFSNPNGDLKFLESSVQSESTKQVEVGPNSVSSLKFEIQALNFGTIKLNVKAVTELAGDAVSQPLIVKPPGQKQTKNKAFLVDLRDTADITQILKAEYPEVRVPGADTLKFSVVSDLLGATITNLDNLIQIPSGCGEQNLLNFVPDIVILDYLTSVNNLKPETKSKAIKFLETGYQRELTYRHPDGSFSAFGTSDPYGSTWLTAFVVRSFISAKKYITIDDGVVTQALRFLTSKQEPEGRFEELGKVLHSGLQGGGSRGSVALSAYVLLAFIEAKNSGLYNNNDLALNLTHTIDQGLQFITREKSVDPYTVNLVSYALQASSHPKTAEYLSTLESLAKVKGELKYWEHDLPKPNKTEEDKYRYTPSIKPVSVEMTAYGLLTYLNKGDLASSLQIGKWLLQQRNAQGGFKSTQDTVVGLTALAKFAAATKSANTDLEIQVGSQEFKVNKENELVLQEAALDPKVQEVTVKGKGTGTALAQLSWSYYVESDLGRKAFQVQVKPKAVSPTKMTLEVCSSFKEEKGKASNMALLEVFLPSGYVFEPEELVELKDVDRVKRYDLDEANTRLNVYFDFLDIKETCVSLPASKIFEVENPAKAYVTVFDYYDTTLSTTVFYEPVVGRK